MDNSEFGGMDCAEEVDVLKREIGPLAGDYGPENPGAGLRTSLASLSGRWNKALPLWLLRNSFWNWFWFWFWFRRLPAT
jgi:hypothetical protein